MKNAVRTILTAILLVLISAIYLFVLARERAREKSQACQGLKVTITDSSRLSFISEKDVEGFLDEYTVIGQPMDKVDLSRVETILSGKSAILDNEAWMDRNGFIHIDIVQREPAVRFQKEDKGFYADKNGFIFPLQKRSTSHVPIIDGAIPVELDEKLSNRPGNEQQEQWLAQIIGLVKYMQKTGWSARIAQITVLPGGDLQFVPEEGNEKFLFGPPTGIDGKFKRIRTYYEAIVPSLEKPKYTSVDVRYDKQIICK